ncbi:helix-turn-helix domain-containing protein [Halorubellus sp. PRR65]|uniref:helix-turn-helix domain-containing protein n=1 Tax=Halorubellus sp. PRR65 TaxID=3098148 RepID=UPI002B2621D1|nr:helix-turn-helix domain-containing protein [Halorubellus sp. PRR65]
MPEARLTLTVPEDTWIGEVSRRYSEATITILAAVTDDDAGVGVAEITADELLSLVEDMTDHDSLASVELLEYHGRTALVQFRTERPMLLLAARGSGLPVEMPFDIQDGQATWALTTTRETLSGLVKQLDMLGIPFEVEEIHESIDATESPLTDRQWTLVEEAVDEGYYDTPRGTTLTELADSVGIAKSTCSETLHRAEERIVKHFVENATQPAGPAAAPVEN